MKPIKLRIKGLNSFIDEQVIDFNKLTAQGLFGIFGPTGSGKSTILDGITLALYGNVARKSSNYINVNCDKANVNFEFQITTDKVTKYIVDREFRRKKDGAINAGKCKIINEDSGDILAEGVKSVNKKVEEILGLNLDDFTRTVVLPQGKFSDFLKLEGRERREMLERLFNLQKYGDVLSKKLSSKIYEEKDNNNILIGQLSGYEDVSEEKFNEKKEELKEIEDKLKNVTESFNKIENLFKENEEVWNLSKELKLYKEKEAKLKVKEEKITELETRVKLGEASSRVMPYLESLESNIRELKNINIELEDLKQLLNSVSSEREKILEIFKKLKEEKEEKLPQLLIKQQKTAAAIEDEKILNAILENINNLNLELKRYETKIYSDEESIKKNKEDIQKRNNEIKTFQQEYDSLKIDETFKQKIQEALLNEQNLNLINKNILNNKSKKEDIEKENEEVTKSGVQLKQRLDEKSKEFVELKEKLDYLEKNVPCNQDDLLKMKELIVINKEKNLRIENLIKDKSKTENLIVSLRENLDPIKYEEKKLQKEIEDLKISRDKAVEKNFIIKLRIDLQEGEECPVCGSVHHLTKDIDHVEIDVEAINSSIDIAEKKIKELNQKIVEDESKIKILNEKIENIDNEINMIKNDIGSKTIEDMEEELKNLTAKLESYNKEKELLKVRLNDIQVEINTEQGEIKTLRAIIIKNRKELEVLNNELNDSIKQSDIINNNLNIFKEETKVDDFKKKNEEIKVNEYKRNQIEEKLKQDRSALEGMERESELLRNDLALSREKFTSIKSNLVSNEKNRDEKIQAIKNKVGDNNDLIFLMKSITEEINLINNNYKEAEKKNDYIEKKFNDINEKLISCQTKNVQLKKMKSECEINLKNSIIKENFSSEDEVRKSYIEDEKITEYKQSIDSYKESVSKVHGNIESLNRKINNRECTNERYNELKNELTEEKNKLEQCKEFKIKIENEVSDLNKKLLELKDILHKKEELEHKMSLLSDLEKLFKGKKFIEFVAASQLKYISIEASKRLKEITHGNYGLEVDDNGKFIIRDYKNGGVARDASTLSGGETFLASLTLALALSAQIQLKGTAPLELFFLDEGFGTLDDDLLEVVMSSLEMIHHDKLKIGIISHVESIKNRIPVKLIVTPAECGVSGSKVKIEIN